MKGSVVVFKRGLVEVRTQFVDSGTVAWVDGDKSLTDVIGDGYKITDDLALEALSLMEDLWDKAKWGGKILAPAYEEVVKILRKI